MSNTIFKFFIVIASFAIFFSIVTIINKNIKNEYPNTNDIVIPLDESVYSDNIQDMSLEHTVIYRDENIKSDMFSECYYALMVDDTNKTIYAAKNVHQRMYPASMTKLMTAIIVCDKIEAGEISLDDEITIEKNYDLNDPGVLPFDIPYGSTVSVKDLLHELLIFSNNYYALILAEYIAGSEEEFCKLMNKKAQSIGATNTHYMNPHGLDHPEHYSTAYDTYLITKEAYSHPLIREINSYESYSYLYTDSNGYMVPVEVNATNYFMNGNVNLPANFNIEVWKTGTTDGAGNCLTMMLNSNNNSYFVVASCGESKADLYDALVQLICLVYQ